MVRLIPPKTICLEFSLVYELEGAQKAINFLSKYYGIKRMKIVVDGRRTGRNNLACYSENSSYFTKNGLKRKIVLHEFYHHLVFSKKIISDKEEQEADDYARRILSKLVKASARAGTGVPRIPTPNSVKPSLKLS